MRVGERILRLLSYDPNVVQRAAPEGEGTVERALDELEDVHADLRAILHERDVVDFGCGAGYQSVAMALLGAGRVTGVDIVERLLRHARNLAGEYRVADRVSFVTQLPEEQYGSTDVVISQNSMEHFSQPGAMLRQMRAVLRPGGLALITFSPPWLAPYGSHMHFFTPVPWVHLIFSERTVMSVRARYRDDGATRYEDVEGGLNRMTLAKFERLVRDSGFRVQWKSYTPVKRIPVVGSIPGLREFFVNRIRCVLEKV
jgi:SAM-dependent methyltransferase